jgi:DNA mismatch repair protein MutS2
MNYTSVLEKLEFNKVLGYIAKYAQTEGGKGRILSILPLENSQLAEMEGEYVNEAKNILIKNIPPPIEYLPEISDVIASSRVEGAVLDGKKIIEIYRLAVMSRNIYQYLKSSSDNSPMLFERAGGLFADKLFEHHIRKILNENGEVLENASPKLMEIRRDIRDKREELLKSVNRLIKDMTEKDFVRENYITLRDGRIVVPVKSEHKRHIRGFIHSESSTGQTVYIEPEETLELNNDIISLSFAERREIERLLKELTRKIGESAPQLKGAYDIILFYDTVFSRAKYSIEIIGSFPSLNKNKPLMISDARHPILLKKFGRDSTVPLNLKVDKKNVILITGPNAGGKTVVLKTVGLLSAMVQSGIHIPASPDSNFHYYENILVDIGDQQSIEDDLSTFSSHLSNINNILQDATEDSLVLLDEIGTGTDPSEGSALAAAILISLRDTGAAVLASTHHGNLKLIANDLEGFENAAMEFDTAQLRPTYYFKQGIPGSSYAFEVAKRIGLSDGFINLAKEYLDKKKHKVETFLVELEAKSRELEDRLRSSERENIRLHSLTTEYQENINRLNKEKKDILRKAKSEAEEYIHGINRKVEKVIKDLKESNASRESVRSSKEQIEDIKRVNENLFTEDIDSQREITDFAIGDFVNIKNTHTAGEITGISKDRKTAQLKVGALKITAALSDLIPAKEKREKVQESFYYPDIQAPQYRLDIRGERPDEVEFSLVKFLDSAYTSGTERVEILHGKGTGALKKTVIQILKKHEKVKNFYFAPIEMGGEGITIAEFKE